MKHSTVICSGLPLIMLLIALVIGLSACTSRKEDTKRNSFDSIVSNSSLFSKDTEIALLKEIIFCIENRKQAELEALFAPSQIADSDAFEQQCADLFSFFNGAMDSYEWKGSSTDRRKDISGSFIESRVSYDIFAAEATYRMALKFCTMDTQNDGNVGIQSLYIIRYEDTDPDFSYGGDGNWTPGINVMTEPQESPRSKWRS